MKGVTFLSVFSLLLVCCSADAEAQSLYYHDDYGTYVGAPTDMDDDSLHDLRAELARERYKTQIAMERYKRERIEQDRSVRDYQEMMRENDYRRAEQERQYRGKSDEINVINQGVNMLGNIIRSAQIFGANW